MSFSWRDALSAGVLVGLLLLPLCSGGYMLVATRPVWTCAWETPVSSGQFCGTEGYAMSTTLGVVMPRDGSITAFGIQCNISAYTSGNVKVEFLKSGTAFAHASLSGLNNIDTIGSGDTWASTGVKKRWVTIPRNSTNATYVAGNFISVRLTVGTMTLETCNILVEPTSDS